MIPKTPLRGGAIWEIILFDSFDECLEDLWFFLRKVGEDLTIEFDIGLLQFVDEDTIAHIVHPNGGVDADLPEGTGVTLLQPTVFVGMSSGSDGRLASKTNRGLSLPAKTFGCFEEILSSLNVSDTAFNSHNRCSA